jgi:anaerobic selenocysteine-containing dehydrogenase
MINVIIEKGLYDREFVEKWCYGFDKVAERVKEYSLQKVAEITWVPADKIREQHLCLLHKGQGLLGMEWE